MADTVTTTKTVSMVAEFSDGDTRTLTQNSPLTDTSDLVDAINAFGNYVKTNEVIIGDKAGGTFQRIKEAKVVNRTINKLDIGLS